jgi:hypothetical protein
MSVLLEAVGSYISSPVFYVLLFLLALGSAAFLFGIEDTRLEREDTPREKMNKVLQAGIVTLIEHLIFGVPIVIIFFYPGAQSRHVQRNLWKAIAPQGVPGFVSYLSQYPNGVFARDARFGLVSESLRSEVKVLQSYEGAKGFDPPVADSIACWLLWRTVFDVVVDIRIRGEPLAKTYERKGVLYTGARCNGSIALSVKSSQTILSERRFHFERQPVPSLYLWETEAGPYRPVDAPFQWPAVVMLAESLLEELPRH